MFVNNTTISKWESGSRLPSADMIARLARALEVNVSLLEVNPCTNVIYLTAYPDYSLDAWDTGACGFLVKPLTPEGVRRQFKMLRHPFSLGGAQA